MSQQKFIVEGRQFRTQTDYVRALKDKIIIDEIRRKTDFHDRKQLEKLKEELKNGTYRFTTVLEQDIREEVEAALKKCAAHDTPVSKGSQKKGKAKKGSEELSDLELAKREKRRKWMIAICSVVAAASLGYFSIYSYYEYRTRQNNEYLSDLRGQSVAGSVISSSSNPNVQQQQQSTHTVQEIEIPEILDEYKVLYKKNNKLIGWLRIADINNDRVFLEYPVMQTTNNEYYLDHNMNQERDKNGSIFMDKDCDVIKPSTNFLVYGHNMKSGQMFGKLENYSSQKFFEDHRYIEFDTIYQKGIYEVMYVFRSQVYSAEEIVFKYYQFINVYNEQEFYSGLEEMAALSLYDTGVTAVYGEQLLTLSTCDYNVGDGRFVVVAKKIG